MNTTKSTRNDIIMVKFALLLVLISSVLLFTVDDIYYAQLSGIPGVILICIAQYSICNNRIMKYTKSGNNTQANKERNLKRMIFFVVVMQLFLLITLSYSKLIEPITMLSEAL